MSACPCHAGTIEYTLPSFLPPLPRLLLKRLIPALDLDTAYLKLYQSTSLLNGNSDHPYHLPATWHCVVPIVPLMWYVKMGSNWEKRNEVLLSLGVIKPCLKLQVVYCKVPLICWIWNLISWVFYLSWSLILNTCLSASYFRYKMAQQRQHHPGFHCIQVFAHLQDLLLGNQLDAHQFPQNQP